MKPIIVAKWPGLLVKGEKVTKDQAREIIVRTTRWPLNNRQEADEKFNSLIDPPKEFNKGLSQIRPLQLNYLHNERITTSYIGGSKGWIDWNGEIFTNNYNIGKWPSAEYVTEDWEMLAKAFPYLNLRCQTLSGEVCEDNAEPTLEWIVKDGKVIVQEPQELLIQPKGLDLDSIFSVSKYLSNEIWATTEDVQKGIELAKRK